MYINDIFVSLEGECYKQGSVTLFIRTQGCDRRCFFCDTKDSWKVEEKHNLLIENVMQTVCDLFVTTPTISKVSVTGGNPLLQINDVLIVVDKVKEIFKTEGIIFNLEHPGVNLSNYTTSYDFVTDDIFYDKLSAFNTITFDIKLPIIQHYLNDYNDQVQLVYKIMTSIVDRNNKINNSINSSVIIPKIIIENEQSIRVLEGVFSDSRLFSNLGVIYLSPLFGNQDIIKSIKDFMLSCKCRVKFYLSIQQHKFLGFK